MGFPGSAVRPGRIDVEPRRAGTSIRSHVSVGLLRNRVSGAEARRSLRACNQVASDVGVPDTFADGATGSFVIASVVPSLDTSASPALELDRRDHPLGVRRLSLGVKPCDANPFVRTGGGTTFGAAVVFTVVSPALHGPSFCTLKLAATTASE